MTTPEDAELTRTLDALLAAKVHQQRRSWAWWALALAALAAAVAGRHQVWILIPGIAGALVALQAGVKAHLRADALRNQAMERILAEALRRSGQEPGA